MPESALPPRRLFRGWLVVAGAFAVTCAGFGSAYSFSAFLQSLQAEFGASRGSVSLVFSLAGFLYFGLGVVSGPLADRWGARPLAIAGMVLVAAGLALAALARSLNEVYLAYSLGVGVGIGLSYVPVVGAVQRWFVRQRGLASGLAVSGIGVGTLLVPPLATLCIDAWGWRAAWAVLGGGVALVGVAMAFLIDDDPRRHGLAPDGDPAPAARAAGPPAGATLGEALRTRSFALLYLAGVLGSFGVFVPFVHVVPYATDHGVPAASAVLLIAAIGVGSTAGRFLLGGLADRMGRRHALVSTFAGMAAAMAAWALCTTFWPLLAFALVFGVFYGAWVAIMPAVLMDFFGGRSISSIIGALYTSVAFGTLVGPSAAGYAFDASGSYVVPILAGAAANVVAALVVAAAGRAARRERKGAPAF
jgi:predicted MFS family arabinose efflux permease